MMLVARRPAVRKVMEIDDILDSCPVSWRRQFDLIWINCSQILHFNLICLLKSAGAWDFNWLNTCFLVKGERRLRPTQLTNRMMNTIKQRLTTPSWMTEGLLRYVTGRGGGGWQQDSMQILSFWRGQLAVLSEIYVQKFQSLKSQDSNVLLRI